MPKEVEEGSMAVREGVREGQREGGLGNGWPSWRRTATAKRAWQHHRQQQQRAAKALTILSSPKVGS